MYSVNFINVIAKVKQTGLVTTPPIQNVQVLKQDDTVCVDTDSVSVMYRRYEDIAGKVKLSLPKHFTLGVLHQAIKTRSKDSLSRSWLLIVDALDHREDANVVIKQLLWDPIVGQLFYDYESNRHPKCSSTRLHRRLRWILQTQMLISFE